MMQSKVLVTGGAGFVGSHLVSRLLARGDEVVVLDDLSTGCRDRLPAGARLIVGSILNPDHLRDAMAGVDCVFHLAALVSVQGCIADWMSAHRINLGGMLEVCQAAHALGGVPVIYASSAAVYGDRSGGACHEDARPLPISPYAADKLGCEAQARAMAEVHGLRSVGLRFFNIYGPGQDGASPYAGVISRFCADRLADRPHVIFGDGDQSRDFIYVADVVDGLLRARDLVMSAPAERATVFNLCTGVSTTLLDLADRIDHIAGRGPLPIRHEPARSGDIRASCGSPDAARRMLGFVARTDIRSGLGALWESVLRDVGAGAALPQAGAKGSRA